MEKQINAIFLDKKNNIYVVDENNILYLIQQDNDTFIPFMAELKNVHKCFLLNGLFYVHHNQTITMFNEKLEKINVFNDVLTDFVDYHESMDIIAVISNNQETFIYFDIQTNFIKSIALNYIYITSNDTVRRIEHQKFDAITIVDNYLLAYLYDTMSVYQLLPHMIKPVRNIHITERIYADIFDYDKNYDAFNLIHANCDGGNMLSMKGYIIDNNELYDNLLKDNWAVHENDVITGYKTINGAICCNVKLVNAFKLVNHKLYYNRVFVILSKQYFYCYHATVDYQKIINSLVLHLPITDPVTFQLSPETSVTILSIPDDIIIELIYNRKSQIIFYANRSYIIGDVLREIVITRDAINFENIITSRTEKINKRLIIDVATSQSIVDQLVDMIPNIYRLNKEYIYHFEQTDDKGEILSYGEGSTRQVFDMCRNEFDAIFKNNFEGYTLLQVFHLGRLFYFCNRDGDQKFFNIHPYFFYLLSHEVDHLHLLKKFEGRDYIMYSRQYQDYKSNPALLELLDLDLHTIDDYVNYLLSYGLSNERKRCYEEFVKGFMFFTMRLKLYNLIKGLPVEYYIQQLVADEYFRAKLKFSHSYLKAGFTKVFDPLSEHEKAIFLQNVTGSKYYRGIVRINIGDTTSEQYSYKINTCEAKLVVHETADLKEVIAALIIEDTYMRN